MSKFSKFLIATAVAAIALPTGAMAASVNASSSGTFSSLSNCDNSGSSQNCGLFNGSTESSTSGTKVEWGSNSNSNFFQASTLTANAFNVGPISIATPNVVLASLTWFNSSTDSERTPSIFDVDYKLTLSFSTGGSGTINDTFDLTIDNTSNPMGDRISAFTLPDLTALTTSINNDLSGWSVNGLKFVTDGGSFIGNSTCGGSGTTTTWCNPEGDTSHLYIEANFAPTTPTGVPEPMTLSLFGAGLAGAAAMRLRRRKKA